MPPKSNQSQANNQENEKPQSVPPKEATSSPPHQEEDDFVDIDHDDVDMQDSEAGKGASDDLELQRFAGNPSDHDDEDDSEEDQDHMANHPLLSMLSGRLGQRRRGSSHQWDVLHPVTQVLSFANVDDCTTLEEATFPEHERCSREKVRHPQFMDPLAFFYTVVIVKDVELGFATCPFK